MRVVLSWQSIRAGEVGPCSLPLLLLVNDLHHFGLGTLSVVLCVVKDLLEVVVLGLRNDGVLAALVSEVVQLLKVNA